MTDALGAPFVGIFDYLVFKFIFKDIGAGTGVKFTDILQQPVYRELHIAFERQRLDAVYQRLLSCQLVFKLMNGHLLVRNIRRHLQPAKLAVDIHERIL